MSNKKEVKKKLEPMMLRLQEAIAEIGPYLADLSDYGSVLTWGQVGPEGERKYCVMLATNDAATHLEEFSREQSEGRLQAMQDLGVDLLDIRDIRGFA